MATPKVNHYTLGRGELHFANFLPGTKTPGGFRYIGNTPAFGVTEQSQEIDHYSSDHGVAELDDSFPTQVSRSGSFSTDNIDFDNLALFFFGSKQTNTLTSATAIAESFVGVQQGLTYQLGMSDALPAGVRSVANVVVKVAAATKVAGTDYTVDVDAGLIYIIEGGGIANGATVDVTYDRTATNYDQVISGSTPREGAIMLKSDNPYGDNKDFLLPWVRITPNGEFALKSENALQSLPFNIKILKQASRAAIYCNGQPYSGS